MRSPALILAGHLMWTRNGTVWATWRLTPIPYSYRPNKEKESAKAWHQALIRALPGESLLMGVSTQVDATSVVERMAAGVDLERCPDWAAECNATLDTLDQIELGDRTYWLSVPLAASDLLDHIRRPARAAMADIRDTLALPRSAVSQVELDRRLDQADAIARAIPAVFHPAEASAAQQVWLMAHACTRGLGDALDLPTTNPGDTAADLLIPRSGVALGEPWLDEGGRSDFTRAQLVARPPYARRYLKVLAANDPAAMPSYQATLVLADVPQGGMLFPGSEFVGRVDESGVDADWAIRLNVRASDKVLHANRRALVNLNDQYHQREGEISHGLATLDRAAEELAEYSAILEADKLEMEAQTTTIFCVAGPTADDAAKQARKLAKYFAADEYRLVQPLGYLEQLWWAMQPGTPSTQVVREFAQIAPSKAAAAMVPLASSALGDTHGSLLGLNLTGQLNGVLHDLDGASGRDNSGSIALAGEKGGGKSLALKKLAGDVVDRGGRVICIDRTQIGEYATWAASVTNAAVVDIAEPAVSLDPLQLFDSATASRVAQSFLTPLLNVAPTSDRGVLLSDVLDPAYLAAHQLPSLGAVLAHLYTACTLPGAADLARLMNVFARRDFGKVIFDPTLPAMDFTAPAVIVRTHTLEMPSRNELEHQHLFAQLRLEKVFGRAMYALLAGFARAICFADRNQFTMFCCDEVHHITGSPEGERELVDFVRDDRKHRAALAVAGQGPGSDFGSKTMRGLIPTKLVMRLRDKTLARQGLEFLDMDPDNPDLVDTLMNDTSPVGPNGVPEHRRGEAFLKDAAGNLGRIKILAPALPSRNEAVRTTPPELEEMPQ